MDSNSPYNIVRVNHDNYHLFDEMVFYRMNGRARPLEEARQARDFSAVFHTLSNPGLFVYAAEIEGCFRAWIAICYLPKIGRTNGAGYLFIDELWTAPEYRRRGIARSLLKKADELCRAYQALGIRLYASNPDALMLYKSCGYAADEQQAYFMQKASPSG